MESVQLLLEAGASPLEEQDEGTAVIHFAASKGNLEILKVCIQSTNRHLCMGVQLLVSKGAKPGAVNKDGDTALTVSIRCVLFNYVYVSLC